VILNTTSSAVTTFNQLAQRDALQAGLSASASTTSQSGSSSTETQSTTSQSQTSTELTPEQKRQIASLQRIDALVRQHEQMHIAAGGSVITSGPNYSYAYGPDGKQYAVSGEVGIDTSPGSKPQENIDKGRMIQRAALAPPDPSPQDLQVAAVGGQLEAQGHSDLVAELAAEREATTTAPRTQTVSPEVAGNRSSADVPTDANESTEVAAAGVQSKDFSQSLLSRVYAAGQGTSSAPSVNLFA
jgi:hypothetical protein